MPNKFKYQYLLQCNQCNIIGQGQDRFCKQNNPMLANNQFQWPCYDCNQQIYLIVKFTYISKYLISDFQRMKGTIKEVGNYIVGQAIGQGSFGKVYKGIDRFDRSQVALKFISKRGKNKKQLQGLRAQNQMLKKISHKNIIKLLDFLQTTNEMIIITQFAGENLADVLQRKKKFNYEQVKAYCVQIFDALCYLDENRIAHRDLKPQNILIQNQVIKICDFGFARKLSASTNFMNSLKGTPLYIAPEILGSGPLNYTKKVDVWSFGIIIYELFSGRPPFYAQNLPRLKPKILYEKVRFTKQMPVELRTLIDRMLQKNPDNRADWQQLKKFEFFSKTQPLKQQNLNKNQIAKQQVLPPVINDPILVRQQTQKQLPPLTTPQKNVRLNRLASNQQIQQMKTIENDLLTQKIQAKKLRQDTNFYEKVMEIYSSYFAGQGIVPKHILNHITSIFLYLITKVKHTQIDAHKDITRKKQLLFCAIKQAEQDTSPETLTNLLMLIGLFIKINFDNVSIDFQTDQDVLQICLRQIQSNRSHSCFAYALTVLGTLACQGILTINNSEQFFVKIQEQNILQAIAQTYQTKPEKRIVLECLQKFIHPSSPPASISRSQQSLRKIFHNLKQQVANKLLKKQFLSQNPFNVYKQISHVETYAKILYECISVSDSFRKQFLNSNYWVEFLNHKNLRIFCFAYDYICIQKDRTCLIPNEVMKSVASSVDGIKKNSIMENIFYFARAQFYLSKKITQTSNKQQSTLKLLNQIRQNLTIDQQSKKKASREVEGFLYTGVRIFEEVLGQIYTNIMNDPIFDKNYLNESIVETILQNLLNLKPEQELKISALTAAKIIISTQQILRLQPLKLRQNKKLFMNLGQTIMFFFETSIIYQLHSQQGPSFTKKLLFSIFNILKMFGHFDQKQQIQFYGKVEEKGIHTLLVAENILDKNTLSICLSILQKLVGQSKFANAVIDFTGLNLIDKMKNFLKLDLEQKDSEIVVQMLHMISLVIKKSEQYASKIKQLDIITHFPRYLKHPSNENVRQQTLNLIGNMAKHSPYFFEDFVSYAIFPSVVDSVKLFGLGNKNKILKGIVYAIGNVSFYTDRFSKDFMQLIPSLNIALSSDDPYLVSNTMSTISNLLRHSNCYLKCLIQNRIIKKVLQIIMQSHKPENKLMFGLNMIKKVLAYPEVFDDHPKSQFIAIYQAKVKIVTEDNECMKKIKTLM